MSKPEWLVGAGLDTDFSGDKSSGASSNYIRYWMPKGATKKIIFLTDGDEAPVLWEHQFKLNGKWQNWATCTKPLGGKCPFCEWADKNDGEYRRYKAAFFTIIDCSEYTDKKGEEHSYTKRLMCCKSGTAEKIKRKWMRLQEDGKTLKGAMFEVYRTNSDKSPSVGEDFEFIKHIDMESLEDSTEFDYAELLKPDVDVAATYISAIQEERGIGTGSSSYDVPF